MAVWSDQSIQCVDFSMRANNEVTLDNNTMPTIVSRRRLLAHAGVIFTASIAGCNLLGPNRPTSRVEREITNPVQVEGEPITITRDISSMNTETVENTSVEPGDRENIATRDQLLPSSKIVQLVKSKIKEMAVKEISEISEGPVDWYLNWDVSNDRLLITTFSTVDSRGGDYVFPSPEHNDLKSNLPSVVTIITQIDKRTISTEIPVYIRARLNPT